MADIPLLITNIAQKAAIAVEALVTEQAPQIQKDINYMIENLPDGKKAILRLSHMIIIDLDTSEQKDVISYSMSRRAETSSSLSETPTGGKLGADDEDDDDIHE